MQTDQNADKGRIRLWVLECLPLSTRQQRESMKAPGERDRPSTPGVATRSGGEVVVVEHDQAFFELNQCASATPRTLTLSNHSLFLLASSLHSASTRYPATNQRAAPALTNTALFLSKFSSKVGEMRAHGPARNGHTVGSAGTSAPGVTPPPEEDDL
jgi:hypothetical protein